MVLRNIIIDKLDRFYAMASMNPPEEMKMLNLENWHIALEDLSDKAIEAGFNAAVKEDVKKMPFPGQFRAMCIIPSRLKEPQYLPEIEMNESAEKMLQNSRDKLSKGLKNDNR